MTEAQEKKVNINVKILPATDEKLEAIAAATYRQKGAVIDWLINAKFGELFPSPAEAEQ